MKAICPVCGRLHEVGRTDPLRVMVCPELDEHQWALVTTDDVFPAGTTPRPAWMHASRSVAAFRLMQRHGS
jgi:hypothetical protein